MNQYSINTPLEMSNSALRRSRAAEKMQSRKISSNLSFKEKQMFKDQFDTFRNIYQGENKHLSRSCDS